MRSFFLFSSLCVYARAFVCVMCVSACIILRHSTFFFAALDHINMQIFQFHIGNHKKYIKRRCKASAEDCVVQLLGIHSCARTHKMNKMIPSLLLHLSCGRGTYTHITYIAGHTCRFVTRKENLLRLFVERGWACVCCVYVCRITSLTLLRFYFNEKKCGHAIYLCSFFSSAAYKWIWIWWMKRSELEWETHECRTRTRSSTFGTKISILRFENVQIHFFSCWTRHEMTEPESPQTPIEMWYIFSIVFIRGKMIWWFFMRRRVCITETKNNIKTEMNQISRCCEAYVYFTNLHALPPSLTLMTAIPGYRICNNKKGKSLFTVHAEQIQ